MSDGGGGEGDGLLSPSLELLSATHCTFEGDGDGGGEGDGEGEDDDDDDDELSSGGPENAETCKMSHQV